jgi:hypothetical protein
LSFSTRPLSNVQQFVVWRETPARAGKCTKKEEDKLKDAVDKHNGKEFAAITALVPGRTKIPCWNRWQDSLRFKTDEATACVGKWTKEEDEKLKDAVDKHKDEGWAAISALLPGRTKKQCTNRWHSNLRYKTDETTVLKGKWSKEEDVKLTDAATKHHGKNWEATAARSKPIVERNTSRPALQRQDEHSWPANLHRREM